MEFGKKIPDVYYRRREAVYAVVLEKNKKVAIIVQNGKGFLPGGGLEIGEEHHTALKRECMEETGYIFKLNQYVGQAEQYFQTRQGEYLMNNGYFYTGSFGEFVSQPLDDDHELLWMEIDDAADILFHSSHVWAVKKACCAGKA